MVMTAKSPLVAGGVPPAGAVPMRWVRVERAFLIGGVRQEPGSVVNLPTALVAELVTAHKATPVDAPAPTPSEPEAPKRAKKD